MPEKQQRTQLKRNEKKNKKYTMTCLSRSMQMHPIWTGNHVINILAVPSSYYFIFSRRHVSALSVKQKPSIPSHKLTFLEIKKQPSSNTSIPGPLSMRTHTCKGKNTFWCMLGCNCHLLSMRTDFILWQRDYWDDNANAHIQCSTQIWCHLCHKLCFVLCSNTVLKTKSISQIYYKMNHNTLSVPVC